MLQPDYVASRRMAEHEKAHQSPGNRASSSPRSIPQIRTDSDLFLLLSIAMANPVGRAKNVHPRCSSHLERQRRTY